MPAPETKSFVLMSEDQGFGVEHHLCVCPGHSCANRSFGMSSSNVYLYQPSPQPNQHHFKSYKNFEFSCEDEYSTHQYQVTTF